MYEDIKTELEDIGHEKADSAQHNIRSGRAQGTVSKHETVMPKKRLYCPLFLSHLRACDRFSSQRMTSFLLSDQRRTLLPFNSPCLNSFSHHQCCHQYSTSCGDLKRDPLQLPGGSGMQSQLLSPIRTPPHSRVQLLCTTPKHPQILPS